MQCDQRPSRRLREKIAHRQEILEAAKKVFARKGFHAATVDEIAQEADFSKGTMYVHFTNKEDLFLSLLGEKTEKLSQILEEIIHTLDDIETKIEKSVTAYLDFFEQDRELFQIMAAEHPRLTAKSHDRLHLKLKERYLNTLSLVDELMQEGINQQQLKQTDPRFLSITFLGIIHSFTAQWLLLGRKDHLHHLKPLIIELFLEGAKKRQDLTEPLIGS